MTQEPSDKAVKWSEAIVAIPRENQIVAITESVEILHIYPWKLTIEAARDRIIKELPWVRAIASPHVVILLDDYFLTGRGSEAAVEQAVNVMLEATSAVGIAVDHIVRESALVKVAEQFFAHIPPIEESNKRWTCPPLAASWQLVRLGLAPAPDNLIVEGNGPLPTVNRCASILNTQFLFTEVEVRTLLTSLPIEKTVWDGISYIFC
jgi:hypothetical protein